MDKAKLKELSKQLKVISNEKRLQIFLCLLSGEKCVCDIYKCLGLAQNLTSHHLGILQKSGLISSRREGKWIFYSLNKKTISQLLGGLDKTIKRKC